jgi:hypothetical protein
MLCNNAGCSTYVWDLQLSSALVYTFGDLYTNLQPNDNPIGGIL